MQKQLEKDKQELISYIKTYIEIIEKEYEFLISLNDIMEEEFYSKYYKYNFSDISSPFEKAKKYSEINYEKANNYIEFYSTIGSVPFKK